jgi:predicted exporter
VRAGRTGWLVLLIAGGLAVYCATRLQVRTDITAFMPAGSDTLLASLSQHLSDSEQSRTRLLVVAAERIDRAVAGASAVAERLRRHPQVAWVRDGVDPRELERIRELYFPVRHGFLFDDPERVASALDEAGLRERARRLRRELARPASFAGRDAAADPLGGFAQLVGRLRDDPRGLALHAGRLVTPDRRFAVVLFATRASAWDADAQRRLQDDLVEMQHAAQRAVGAPLRFEQSGGARFAVQIQASVQRDVRRALLISTSGVVAIFLLFFRSLRTLGIGMLPLAAGALVAASAGTFVFGTLNGLAVAFGASLVGVSIDYSVHLINHLRLPQPGEEPGRTLRRLRPSLLLGGATTLASLVGLGFANFPGFHQMGALAVCGVGCALWVALRWLPALVGEGRAPALSPALAAALGRGVARLGRRRGLLAGLALACGLAGLAALPRLEWQDDLGELTVLDAGLLAEEESVRRKVSRFDAHRFAAVRASSWEQALARNDRLYRVLSREVEAGRLAGFRSLHPLLRSAALQRANERALRADPELPARLERAYAAEGFRPGAFDAFARALAADPPAPLDLERLRASQLSDWLAPFVADTGAERVLLTWLEGIADERALRAAVEGVEGALFFDQRRFLREVYSGYRERTRRVVATGALAVFALLWLRYRRLRESVAAFLPSLLVVGMLAALAVGLGVRVNVVHLIGLVLVMGMGVDYGIFLVDSRGDAREVGVTMLSLLLSCLTTLFVFGVLALSEHPVLRALGATSALGVALAFALAPLALSLAGRANGEGWPDGATSRCVGLPAGEDGDASGAPPASP